MPFAEAVLGPLSVDQVFLGRKKKMKKNEFAVVI